MKSIIEKLNTQCFNRIRVGIGSPPENERTKKLNTISHVLGNISPKEKIILENVYEQIILSLEEINQKTESQIISNLNSFNK